MKERTPIARMAWTASLGLVVYGADDDHVTWAFEHDGKADRARRSKLRLDEDGELFFSVQGSRVKAGELMRADLA